MFTHQSKCRHGVCLMDQHLYSISGESPLGISPSTVVHAINILKVKVLNSSWDIWADCNSKNPHTHTDTHTHTHTHTLTRAHTYTHKHTHKHTHIRTTPALKRLAETVLGDVVSLWLARCRRCTRLSKIVSPCPRVSYVNVARRLTKKLANVTRKKPGRSCALMASAVQALKASFEKS